MMRSRLRQVSIGGVVFLMIAACSDSDEGGESGSTDAVADTSDTMSSDMAADTASDAAAETAPDVAVETGAEDSSNSDFAESDLVGSWAVVSVTLNGVTMTNELTDMGDGTMVSANGSIALNEDRTYAADLALILGDEVNELIETGTWAFSTGRLTLSSGENGSEQVFDEVALDDERTLLTLSSREAGTWVFSQTSE